MHSSREAYVSFPICRNERLGDFALCARIA
jgi:hypothetical protein